MLIATSSGAVCVRRALFWIPPWRTTPWNAVQVVSDSTIPPTEHDQLASNYAVSKLEAETTVREADDAPSGFRTGCIRPTNGIYGIAYDAPASVTGDYLKRGQHNVTYALSFFL